MATTDIPQIYTALMKFQGLIQVIPFDSVNPHFKNKYASLAAIVKACAPHMQTAGLCFTQTIDGLNIVTRVICANDGSEIVSTLALPIAPTANAQAIGSAITYMKRYAICAVLGIVGDDDDDGNLAQKAEPKQTPMPVIQPAKSPAALKLEALWSEFEKSPTDANLVEISKKVAQISLNSVAGFEAKAKAHINAILAAEVAAFNKLHDEL